MTTSLAPTADLAPARVAIPQYGIRRILAVWAAAALPMLPELSILSGSIIAPVSLKYGQALFPCLRRLFPTVVQNYQVCRIYQNK